MRGGEHRYVGDAGNGGNGGMAPAKSVYKSLISGQGWTAGLPGSPGSPPAGCNYCTVQFAVVQITAAA
ncbi:hypothetical protein V494_04875 [Pseudogymnoascus sp. VKM F-4513 (FW-928)]|nr:hypothetical protein V494_04875 [Pseudogymnoascus sp. VKM F-4513 (FW-928)]